MAKLLELANKMGYQLQKSGPVIITSTVASTVASTTTSTGGTSVAITTTSVASTTNSTTTEVTTAADTTGIAAAQEKAAEKAAAKLLPRPRKVNRTTRMIGIHLLLCPVHQVIFLILMTLLLLAVQPVSQNPRQSI